MCAVSVHMVRAIGVSYLLLEWDLWPPFGDFSKTHQKRPYVLFLSGNHCRLSWKTFLRFHCRCHDCGAILEEYDEETLGLAIVVLSTFIHLSPDLAAPLLLDIMQSVGRWLSASVRVAGRSLIQCRSRSKNYSSQVQTFMNLIGAWCLWDPLRLILKTEWLNSPTM